MSLRRIEEINSYLEAKEKKIKEMYLEKQYQLPLRLDKFLLYNNIEEIKGNAHKFGYDINKPCMINLYFRENKINSQAQHKAKNEKSFLHKPNNSISNNNSQIHQGFNLNNKTYLKKLNYYVKNSLINSQIEKKIFNEKAKISLLNTRTKDKLEFEKLNDSKNNQIDSLQNEIFVY